MPSWALAMVEAEAGSPRLDREEANLRSAYDALLAREPREALGYCVALSPFWLRRIDLQEAHRRFAQTLVGRARAHGSAGGGAACRLGDRLRAGTLACGADHAEESYEIACELADVRAQWRALQRLGEFAVGHDHDDSGSARCSSAARETRASAGPRRRRGRLEYSLGVARWLLGDLAGGRGAAGRVRRRPFARWPTRPTRHPSPLNIAEMRAADPAAQPGAAHRLRGDAAAVRRDLLRRGDRLRARPTRRRSRASAASPTHARGLLDEAAARFADAATTARARPDVLVRRTYLELSRGPTDEAREASRRRWSCAAPCATGAASAWRLWRSASWTRSPVTTSAPSSRSPRRAICSVAPATAGGSVSALWRTADLAFARGRLDRGRRGVAASARGGQRNRSPALDRGHLGDTRRGRRTCVAMRRPRRCCPSRRGITISQPTTTLASRRCWHVCKASPRIGKERAK